MSIAFDIQKVKGGPRIGLGAAVRPKAGSALLRWSIRATDGLLLALAWTLALSGGTTQTSLAVQVLPIAALTALGLGLISHNGLYLARVATMRTVEHALIARVCGMLLGGGAILHLTGLLDLSATEVIVGSGLSLVLLLAGRTVYRAWIAGARAAGRFTQEVVLVGADHGATELRSTLDEHPELGYAVVGVVADRADAAAAGLDDLWLGNVEDAPTWVGATGATGAIISTSALDQDLVNSLTKTLLAQRCHVHLSTGLTGVHQRRLRSVHVGYEPLVYVERPEAKILQPMVKRAMDLTMAAVLTLVTAPVLLAAAIAIKLEDRGPILFRQQRVGLDGELFPVLKLRTMVTDAEAVLEKLRDQNERHGPLFKLEHDPRVTRVGRILRALSIDELPQLFNVLAGQMSLVGPRPALPSEVEQFTDRLRGRSRVLPGITGLWQVEARDNPSFRAYERLDLFYVENWSIGLDVMILIATVESELARVLRRLMGREVDVDADLELDLTSPAPALRTEV